MNVILEGVEYSDLVGIRQTSSSKLFRAVIKNGEQRQKVILKFLADGAPTYLIEKELRALQSIRGDGIIRFYGGALSPIPHIVTEHISGAITLDDFLCSLPKSPKQQSMPFFNEMIAAYVIREIARGLLSTHRAGFIHGDLKPANMIIDTQGRFRLIDFGFSTPLSEPAHNRAIGYGSVQYSDPWQMFGFCSNKVSIKQDLYPLGVILYETAFRRKRLDLPKNLTEEERLEKLRYYLKPDRFTIPYLDYPSWIIDAMKRTCRYDDSKRWESVEELIQFMHQRGAPTISRGDFVLYLRGIRDVVRKKKTNKVPPPSSWLEDRGITIVR